MLTDGAAETACNTWPDPSLRTDRRVARTHAQAGYAVIFLSRTGSIQPYTQELPLSDTLPLLQSLLDVSPSQSQSQSPVTGTDAVPQQQPLQYALREPTAGRVAHVLSTLAGVQAGRRLLELQFTTIFEYLQVGWVCSNRSRWVAQTQGAWAT